MLANGTAIFIQSRINGDNTATYQSDTGMGVTLWYTGIMRNNMSWCETDIVLNGTYANSISSVWACDNAGAVSTPNYKYTKTNAPTAISSIMLSVNNTTYPLPIGTVISVLETEIL